MSSRPESPLALLLTARWLGITLLVVVLSALFAFASSWQYHRAIEQVEAARAVASEPEPIAALVPDGADRVPADALGRTATASGSYIADAWVVGRASSAGEPGVWLISALDDGSGTHTAVLRGWLPGRAPTPSSSVAVEVTGRVSSPENFYAAIAPERPDELVSITPDGLAGIWGLPLRAGYVVLTEQEPGLQQGDPVPVSAVFGVHEDVEFPWQNVSYAVQWAVFIAFVGFMYVRLFRDDLRERREPAAVAAPRVEVPGR